MIGIVGGDRSLFRPGGSTRRRGSHPRPRRHRSRRRSHRPADYPDEPPLATRWLKQGEARWSELGGGRFIDLHPGWGARGLTDRAFASAGAVRQVSLEVNDVHTLIDVVGHGLGVAVVRAPIVGKPQAAALKTVRLTGVSPELLWRLSVVAPSPDTTAPAARKLMDYLGVAAFRPRREEAGGAGVSSPVPRRGR
ncbi:LysR substrate-binding domain-containing protein [[Actinomadura] parvosata]|uniref:LysR substrate-binding domain-containing protein n=1 Tax=[Actinomadura] parvosata TaxID=1955412 RepID=UPI00406CC96D